MKKLLTSIAILLLFQPDSRTQVLGDPNPGFGTGGIVMINSFFPAGLALNKPEGPVGIAVQADGKIVSIEGSGGVISVIRVNPDGSLDNSFDGDGAAFFSDPSGLSATAVAIQSDGKIIIGGRLGSQVMVMRLNTNGTIDGSFDGDGISLFPAFLGSCKSIAIQTDGRIVIGGGDGDAFIARLNTNGSLDLSFDGDGWVNYDIGNTLFPPLGFTGDVINSITLQNDGKILATGAADRFCFVLRLNTNGSFDLTFAPGIGVRLVNVFPGLVAEQGTSIKFRFGSITLAVTSHSYATDNNSYGVVRLLSSNGDFDPSFDGDGIKTLDVVNTGLVPIPPATLIVDNSGFTYLGGSISTLPGTYYPIVYKLTLAGGFDVCFSNDGKVIYDSDPGLQGRFQSVAQTPFGQLVGVGTFISGLLPTYGVRRILLSGAFMRNTPVSNNSFSPQWTWVKGSNLTDALPVLGTQGIPNPGNTPGGVSNMAGWMDANENIWIFGGRGFNSVGSIGNLNDLWKYDPSTNRWTWVKGANLLNQVGVYGTKGVSAPGNTPGGRTIGTFWTDNNGKFWLFGGIGFGNSTLISGRLSDLWRFDPVTNEWTWMNGDNTPGQNGIYGTQGIPSPTNKPGGRSQAQTWVDKNGNLWMFGGFGLGATGSTADRLNDLWMFDPSANMWTWVNGDNSIDQPDIFVAEGVADLSNKPGGKSAGCTWREGDDLYFFGGTGARACVSGINDFIFSSNDLWKYNIPANIWTFLKGDNLPSWPGIYGTQGLSAVSNIPGSRNTGIALRDKNGNMLLLGGNGPGSNGASSVLNDIWKYDPPTNEWVWLGGSHLSAQAGTYGIQGIADAANFPGGRSTALGFTNANGDIFIMGGSGIGSVPTPGGSLLLNDIWKLSNVVTLACPGNAITSTLGGQCKIAVTGIDPVLTPANAVAIVNYNLSGATSGSGLGSVSGLLFNTGITTVTYTLADDPSQTCQFTVTVNYPLTPSMNISISDAVNDFCNGILLTANSNVPVASYSWSNGPTTQTDFLTTANPSGLYTVTAVSQDGCPTIPQASFNYDKESVASSYTILGIQKIKLHKDNTVVNGSVGVVNASGSASFKKNTSIAGPGAFLKANAITLNAPYTIPTILYAPAVVTLPAMQYNTSSTSGLPNANVPNNTTITLNGNLKNVNIGKNCNITMTGTVFGNITIGAGSQVCFTQSSLNATSITMEGGNNNGLSQLCFNTDAVLRCSGDITVRKKSIINPDNHKVIFYLGKTNGGSVSFVIDNGDDITVNASLYIPSGKLTTNGDDLKNIYMNGKFIAEKVEMEGAKVTWNWFDCSGEILLPRATDLITKNEKDKIVIPNGKVSLKNFPNPFSGTTTIEYSLPADAKVELSIFNSVGKGIRILKYGFVTKGSHSIQFEGGDLNSGIYFCRLRTVDENNNPVFLTNKIILIK